MAEGRRKLDINGPQISAMGLGCWAIGGPFEFDGRPAGWGEVDDEESVRAIRRALEIGRWRRWKRTQARCSSDRSPRRR